MKKLLPAIVAALLLPLLAIAATDYFTISNGGRVPATSRFACGVAGQAASLLECVPASPGTAYYITDIVVQTTTATSGDFAIQSGTGVNCATGTAVVWPPAPGTLASRYKAPIAANPATIVNFTTPLKVTDDHAICVIGTAVNTINLTMTGYKG
jgi:hypothetical protein